MIKILNFIVLRIFEKIADNGKSIGEVREKEEPAVQF